MDNIKQKASDEYKYSQSCKTYKFIYRDFVPVLEDMIKRIDELEKANESLCREIMVLRLDCKKEETKI